MSCIIYNCVCVASSKSKRIDRDTTRSSMWPRVAFGRDLKEDYVNKSREVAEISMPYRDPMNLGIEIRIDFLEESIRWYYPSFQDHYSLQDASDCSPIVSSKFAVAAQCATSRLFRVTNSHRYRVPRHLRPLHPSRCPTLGLIEPLLMH
jgi:hypothetical protein